jgi:hypothetical protein
MTMSKKREAQRAISRIEGLGLYINSCVKDGAKLYYVSIDAREPDEESSDDQHGLCHFRPTPAEAADAYIQANPDSLGFLTVRLALKVLKRNAWCYAPRDCSDLVEHAKSRRIINSSLGPSTTPGFSLSTNRARRKPSARAGSARHYSG